MSVTRAEDLERSHDDAIAILMEAFQKAQALLGTKRIECKWTDGTLDSNFVYDRKKKKK